MQDKLREVCIKQGYVTGKCMLDGRLILGLIQNGKNPCLGCNVDRSICRSSIQNKSEKSKIENKYTDTKNSFLRNILEIDYNYNRKLEIVFKLKDIQNGKCYVGKFETIDIAANNLINIISKYTINQIHIDITGFGRGIYDYVVDILERNNTNIDIIPFRYLNLKL